jgi:dTDP-4-dehydrorhamnose 3,5-epimerase-like enzyme
MDIRMFSFSEKGDDRGSLVAIEDNTTVPFAFHRVYYIYNTRFDVVRGLHAHKTLEQMLICVCGSCVIVLDDGSERKEVLLDEPTHGLYIGPMMWREMKDFSPGAVLLVLASEHYNELDYIRDYSSFLTQIKKDSQRG